MVPIRLMLVDDHKLLTDIWTIILNRDERFRVVASTNDTRNAIALLKEYKPDIVLTDINMQPLDGVTLTSQIAALTLPPQVIAVTMYSMLAYVRKMLDAGARGYVTKNSPKEELFEAITTVHNGGKYICREITDLIAHRDLDATASLNRLSRREVDIIQLIKEGLSSQQIGDRIGVKRKTVEVHRYNILRKLGVNNVASLMNLVGARGL